MGDSDAPSSELSRHYGDNSPVRVTPRTKEAIRQLCPLPESWRKKKATAVPQALAAPMMALSCDGSGRVGGLMTVVSDVQQTIASALPATGNALYTAHISPTPLHGHPSSPLSLSSLSDPGYAIKPLTPRASTSTSAVSSAGGSRNSRDAAIASSSENRGARLPALTATTIQGNRTLAYSLNLIIEALAYNQMSLDSGFSAFDADADGRISLRDFHTSVDDLQLELDVQAIELMHCCLDADSDGFIGKQEWITGLNAVQSAAMLTRAPPRSEHEVAAAAAAASAADWASDGNAVRVPLGLDPSMQAHMAFETVRGRLEAALKEKALSDTRIKHVGRLQTQVSSAEHAAAHIQQEIASAVRELNTAIEFDLGRMADREREHRIQWDKKRDDLRLAKDREVCVTYACIIHVEQGMRWRGCCGCEGLDAQRRGESPTLPRATRYTSTGTECIHNF